MQRFAAILLIFLSISLGAQGLRESAPSRLEFPRELQWSGPSDTLTIFVLGDVMSHGKVQKSAAEHGYGSFFKYIEDRIQGADLAVCNMEFPLGGKPYSGYPVFSGPDDFAQYLSDVGFDVLLTANNHMLDKGSAGLSRTIDRLEKMGIVYTGIAGSPAADTLQNPLMVHVGSVSVAIVNCTYGTEQGQQTLWPKVHYMNRKKLLPVMRRARRADLVLVFPHWGVEYAHFHSPAQEDFARWLISNGADAVIGGHPHVVQDVQFIDGVPVVYSLGNALSNQNDLPARLEAALSMKIICRFGEAPRLDGPYFEYLWCTKPGMVEVSYSAVPVTSPAEIWKDPADYEKMSATLSSLKKIGIIR